MSNNVVYDLKNVRGLARLISQVENREPAGLAELPQLFAAGGGSYCLGVTGPPGAGKSTLVDQLVRELRAQDKRVAVLAIDPSSPFTGGAVLGDRIRMQDHAGDDGVYIRSLGSRGAHGGLSYAARDILCVLSAFQFDWIIIETVGVGQSEFDIMELADTTAVVLVPEAGDTVQSLKAGLLEVADIFVVNKADRDGASQMQHTLQAMIQLGKATSGAGAGDHNAAHEVTEAAEEIEHAGWDVPVLMSVATKGEGAAELCEQAQQHRAWAARDSAACERRAEMRRREFLGYLGHRLRERVEGWIGTDAGSAEALDAIGAGHQNPYELAEQLLQRWKVE